MAEMLKGFGQRLREERRKLGKSVEDFAEMSGIHANSLGNYERGERPANAALMLIWHDLAVDIGYVLTGIRTNSSLNADEQRFIDNFLRLDAGEQEIVSALISRLVGDPVILGETSQSAHSLHSPPSDYRTQPKEG